MDKRYAVSVEICHILDREKAEELAEKIKHRLNDIQEDIYVCISDYVQVNKRLTTITAFTNFRLKGQVKQNENYNT